MAEIRSKLASLGLLEHDQVAPGAGLSAMDGFDGFDEACDRAVRGFQQARGLSVDGLVGPETYRALDEARWQLGDRVLSHRVSNPIVGDDVAELQHRLQELGFDAGRTDGIFGGHTEVAVREFQRNVGLAADGTCGPQTLKALARLRRTVVGGRAQWIRETEELHRAGSDPVWQVHRHRPGARRHRPGWPPPRARRGLAGRGSRLAHRRAGSPHWARRPT